MPQRSSPVSNSQMLDTWGRANNRKLQDKACENCGKQFRPLRKSSRYCSRRCSWDNNGSIGSPEVWWINQRGYVEGRIRVAEGEIRVKKHRLVVERAIGRKLDPSEDVHHIDGNKLNNDISNLQVLSHSEHSRLTNLMRAKAVS